MPPDESFEEMLTGGHHNSLGRTVEVVDCVLAQPERMKDLFGCYGSDDEVVRLRTSSAIKRVTKAQAGLVVPFLDRLINEIGILDQASAQWTLAQLFQILRDKMSATQIDGALGIMKRNLAEHGDWIVLNTTVESLVEWSENDDELTEWLKPHLARLANDSRKSVSKRAQKALSQLA